MRPSVSIEANPTPQRLREEVQSLANQLGPSSVSKKLPAQLIRTTETRIAHAMNARVSWRTYDVQADARIWQTKPSDTEYLYLQASANVTAGIEVF